MAELPAFIEAASGEFKPIGECTRADVLAAAASYATDAARMTREAGETIEADPARAARLTRDSNEYLGMANALERHAATLHR